MLIHAADARVDAPRMVGAMRALAELSQEAELVVVAERPVAAAFRQAFDALPAAERPLPVSLVILAPGAPSEDALRVGLGRAVGDFVVFVPAQVGIPDRAVLEGLYAGIDDGFDIVENVRPHSSALERRFFALANRQRDRHERLVPAGSRVFSRRASSYLMELSERHEPLVVLVSETGLERAEVHGRPEPIARLPARARIAKALKILATATRLSRTLPQLFAAAFVLVAASAAVFAVSIALIRGRAPEGWVTLMVLTGVGHASTMVLLGLLYMRVDELHKRTVGLRDPVAAVEVWGPGPADGAAG